MNINNVKIPKALFNSKALFNPYQYLPFQKILVWDEKEKKYVTRQQCKNQTKELYDNVLITDEVGVGKTFEIGIILREMLYSNPNLTVLILCPVKLCENWEKELKENFFIGAINYNRTKMLGQISIVPYSAFRKNCKDIKAQISAENEMQKENSNIADYKEIDFLNEILPYDVLILDEAHYIRNKGSLWQYVKKIVESAESLGNRTKIFMTGTPVFNNENDYENITELLLYNSQTFGVTTTLQSEANCYERLLKISIYQENNLNKNNGIGVDEATRDVINDLDKSKYGRLTGFLKRLSASSIYSLKQFIEKRDNFQQAEEDWDNDGISDEETDVDFSELKGKLKKWPSQDGDKKLNALRKLLDDKKNKSDRPFKAIIFSCFINTCKYLEVQLSKDYHIYMLTGQTTAKNVENNKAAFEKNKEPSILICSDAAKEGHNLQFCQYLIHYDLPYTPAAIGQRNGRIYRRGQEGNPEAYYMLLSEGYDLRLFGEIIVEKCEVIKGLEEEEKLSWINILPNDADDYINRSMKCYINDRLEEIKKEKKFEKGDEKKAAMEFLKEKFSVVEIDEQGKRKKDENISNLLVWKFGNAKKLYDEINGNKEDVINAISDLFTKDNDPDRNTRLKAFYENRYAKKVIEFMKRFMEKTVDDKGTDVNEKIEFVDGAFVAACKEIVGDAETKFCHELIEIDGKEILSIKDYKEQFKPLMEWERK